MPRSQRGAQTEKCEKWDKKKKRSNSTSLSVQHSSISTDAGISSLAPTSGLPKSSSRISSRNYRTCHASQVKSKSGSSRKRSVARRKSEVEASKIRSIYYNPPKGHIVLRRPAVGYIPWHQEGQSEPKNAPGKDMKCVHIKGKQRKDCSHELCERRRSRRDWLKKRDRHVSFQL